MRETRQAYDPEKMVDRYIEAYETLNGGTPLNSVESTQEPALDPTTYPRKVVPICIQLERHRARLRTPFFNRLSIKMPCLPIYAHRIRIVRYDYR